MREINDVIPIDDPLQLLPNTRLVQAVSDQQECMCMCLLSRTTKFLGLRTNVGNRTIIGV
jgi:hypothetical protein